MNKRKNRFFITYFFTSLFLLLFLLQVFPSVASAKRNTPEYLWHLYTGSAVDGKEGISAVVTDEVGNIFIAAEGMKWAPGQETDPKYGNPGRPLHWHSGGDPINKDIMVAKFNSEGKLLWYTYYGGLEEDTVRGMAIADGKLYITGTSRDNWGPGNKQAIQQHSRALLHPSHTSGVGYWYYEYSDDIYVLSLNKYTGEYNWHTFIGESKWNEQVYGIAANAERVFLVGKADAEFFGCWPNYSSCYDGKPCADEADMERKNRKCKALRAYQGGNDAWALALTTKGYYVQHTFLGSSSSDDWGEAIAIDQNGMVVVAGSSDKSWNYNNHAWYNTPPRNDHSGGHDMWIARLAGSDLEYHWHAFFGGPDDDWATAVLTDDDNGYYLAGYSQSNWPVKGRYPVAEHTAGINYDFAVVKMNNEGANGWHTFRGRDKHEDIPHAMALSLDGTTLYVAGEANGPWVRGGDGAPVHDFTKDGGDYQIGVTDMAILGLDALSGKSRWHTFYGGLSCDRAYSLAVDAQQGDIVVAGKSNRSWAVNDKNPIWSFPGSNDGKNDNFALLRLHPYKYTITASVSGTGGTISPNGAVVVGYLKDQAFEFKPDTGYEVKEVRVDGSAVTITNNKYTFAKVAKDHTIQVAFKLKKYTIKASSPFIKDGQIDPSGDISVAHGGNQTFTFTPANGMVVVGVKVDNTSQNYSQNSYTFTNVTGNHSIKVYFGYIITASAETGGGTINPQGQVRVIADGDQTFHITPSTGYEIDKVLVNGQDKGSIRSYTFEGVNKNNTIKAFFKKKTFTITVSQGPGGTISPSDDVTVSYGGNQDFYIKADTANGYVIDKLTADSKTVGAASGKESYTHTFSNVTQGHSISVTFKLKTLIITASAGTGGGTIEPSGDVQVTYGEGRTFNITADATNSYRIDKLLVDGNEVAGVSGSTKYSYPFTNVQYGHTIEARFIRLAAEYTITASAGTDGGNIDPSGDVTVTAGSNQTFNITADTTNHYVIDKLLVDGNSVPDAVGKIATSYTFYTVTRDSTITASFKQVFTITASAGTGGRIDPSGSVQVAPGSDQIFNIAADTDNGYRIDTLLVDGIKVTNASGLPAYSERFTNVTGNHEISVTFTQPAEKYTITASAEAGGTISPDGVTEVTAHGSQTYTIKAGESRKIKDVIVDGKSTGATTTYEFTDVTTNHTISAIFESTMGPGI